MRIHLRGISVLCCLLVLLLLAATEPLAAQNKQASITNADILKMVKAGISDDIILRTIQTSNTNFDTSPDALVTLKNQGVPDLLLRAMLDSRGKASQGESRAIENAEHRVPGSSALRGLSVGMVSVNKNDDDGKYPSDFPFGQAFVIVQDIEKDSPAARSSLDVGDLIEQIISSWPNRMMCRRGDCER
jgi:hypothetical protein